MGYEREKRLGLLGLNPEQRAKRLRELRTKHGIPEPKPAPKNPPVPNR
jgi:hypothetical protein